MPARHRFSELCQLAPGPTKAGAVHVETGGCRPSASIHWTDDAVRIIGAILLALFALHQGSTELVSPTRLAILEPRGEIHQPPRFIRWLTPGDAHLVRVIVSTPDGDIVLDTTTTAARRHYPLSARNDLSWPRGHCRLRLIAMAADGYFLDLTEATVEWLP